jgi:hypothetical protein
MRWWECIVHMVLLHAVGRRLFLYSNQLTGTIPAQLSALTGLT